MSTPEEMQLEVFRAGDYGPRGVYTEDDLDTIAADYDAQTHEAPVTFDHEQKGPAHGWVAALRRAGDRLVATVRRISPALADAIRSHAFKKRSVELYRRLPATGRPYLKALSFLGAAVPEVKGLADPIFADGAGEVVAFEEDVEHADAPQPDSDVYTEQARRQLVERGAWNPAWEDTPLLAVFRALGGDPAAGDLLEFLATLSRPVDLGPAPLHEQPPEVAGFADDVVGGGGSIDSRLRHHAAMRFVRQEPGLAYRDALLRI